MSKIEWTNVTWNPVTGCNKVSQGCKNCYAEIMHRRLRGMFPQKYGKPFLGGVDVHEDELSKPATWKTPRMVFVNSMSDLFHDDVPLTFIRQIFRVMYECHHHTFQILTKRPQRMVEIVREIVETNLMGVKLKNVWLGTSCEDQETADERIPLLLQVPAAVRFLSCEPLLGPLNISTWLNESRYQYLNSNEGFTLPALQWVITGGESGHHARPVHPDWVRSLRDQCKAAGVPFFFKQWGEYLPFEPTQPPFWRNAATGHEYDGHGMDMIDPHTGDAGKWKGFRWHDPMDSITLCLDAKSSDCNFLKVGKHNSSNRLDGKQHLEFPTA